jgi:hypothetical protein
MAVACDWVFICERAYFDPHDLTKSLNVTRIVEHAVVDPWPGTIGPFMIVAHMDGFIEQDIAVGIRSIRPSGTFVPPQELVSTFEHIGPYLIGVVHDFAVTEQGPHRFEIFLDRTVVAQTTLRVSKRTTAVDPIH